MLQLQSPQFEAAVFVGSDQRQCDQVFDSVRPLSYHRRSFADDFALRLAWFELAQTATSSAPYIAEFQWYCATGLQPLIDSDSTLAGSPAREDAPWPELYRASFDDSDFDQIPRLTDLISLAHKSHTESEATPIVGCWSECWVRLESPPSEQLARCRAHGPNPPWDSRP